MKTLIISCIILITNSLSGEIRSSEISDNITVLSDTTRSRDKSAATKERVRKNGSSNDGHGGIVFEDEDDSFTGACLSSCFEGLLQNILFAAFSTEEDNFTSADSSLPEAAALSDDGNIVVESPDYKPPVKANVMHAPFRYYFRGGIGGENFTGEASEEYKKAAFSYRLSNVVLYKGFVVNVSFSQGFLNGEPLYDYKTTKNDDGNIIEVYDIASSTYVSNSTLSIGAGYSFDFSEFTGMSIGAGGLYQSVMEETEISRETILNGQSEGRRNMTETLKFSGFYPFVSADFFIYLNPEASFILDFNFQYNFINRSPALIKSTPLDWNKLTGEFIFGIGFSFNIL